MKSLVLSALFIVLACTVVKIQLPGFASVKLFCSNPTAPVNTSITATSPDGRSVATVSTYVSASSNVFIFSSAKAY
jgi:hypothetical protein